jgi:hypothetical protein
MKTTPVMTAVLRNGVFSFGSGAVVDLFVAIAFSPLLERQMNVMESAQLLHGIGLEQDRGRHPVPQG